MNTLANFPVSNSGRRFRARVDGPGTTVALEVYSAQHRLLTRESLALPWREASALGLQLVQAATRSGGGQGSGHGAYEIGGNGREYAASALGDGRVRLHIRSLSSGDNLHGETFTAEHALTAGMQLIRASGVAQAAERALAAA